MSNQQNENSTQVEAGPDPQRKALGRLKAVINALGVGAEYLEASLDAGQAPYHLIVVRDAGEPECRTYDDFDELATDILELREQQASDTDNRIYMYTFQGARLQLQKGPAWALRKGEEVFPLQPLDAEQYVDDSGALFEPPTVSAVAMSPPDNAHESGDPADSPVPASEIPEDIQDGFVPVE
jgi:hypothetical protein